MDSKEFSIQLLKWYEQNKRDLPWRNTNNPYAIWLSEIILQQTRVAQGITYYFKFLATYPDIFAFASASEDEVMKLWQGLGYYSRARYMIHTAREIVNNHNGIFPSTYNNLLKLKGIGEYTAAAIASISFNEPVAVVDGNVLRVFSRYAGIHESIDKPAVRKAIRDALELLIDKKKPSEFNQAIMELGAICCTPRAPACDKCPLLKSCYAAAHNLQEELPRKKAKAMSRIRYFHYLILSSDEKYYLNKRSGKDIWNALYEFPLIETEIKVAPLILLEMQELKNLVGNGNIEILDISGPFSHKLSHQTIHAYFYHLKLKGKYSKLEREFISVSREAFHEYAFPRLIERYLEENDYLE
jgi:A/G-specific adenine glycosylase